MKKYNLNVNRDMLEALVGIIATVMMEPAEDLEEKLLYTQLLEVKKRFEQVLINVKHRYNIKLPAAHSIAIVLLYNNYCDTGNMHTYSAVNLKRISNEITKQFD